MTITTEMMKSGCLVSYRGNEISFTGKVMEDLERLNRNFGRTLNEMLDRYFIKDAELRNTIRSLGVYYKNGDIPEFETNKYDLTPRHVQITFGGEFRVICGQYE